MPWNPVDPRDPMNYIGFATLLEEDDAEERPSRVTASPCGCTVLALLVLLVGAAMLALLR